MHAIYSVEFDMLVRLLLESYHCCSLTEVLSKGTWKPLQEMEDPVLKELAGKFPGTIIASRANATTRKYKGAFWRWKGWASRYGLEAIPAKDFQFALYLHV